jgi:hypothetical protein
MPGNIPSPPLLQCTERGLCLVYFLRRILFIFNIETDQFNYPQQLDAIECFLNYLIVTVSLDLSMY